MEKKKDTPLYAYKPLVIPNNGPGLPSLEDILEKYVQLFIETFAVLDQLIN